MNESELTKEERILRAVKRVLTDVARDTHTQPGMKHPLTERTIVGIRDCLALISAREAELAEEMGRANTARPKFVDEPQTTHVIPLHQVKRKKPEDSDHGD